MRPLVGVLPILEREAVKHHLLLCDRLAYAGLDEWIDARAEDEPSLAADIEWLRERDILFDPRHVQVPVEVMHDQESPLRRELDRAVDVALDATKNLHSANLFYDRLARSFAMAIREGMDVDAVALTRVPDVGEGADVRKTEVMRVVFKEIPIPDEHASIEQILDFAHDARERNLVQGLRVFVTDLARGDLPVSDLRDRIQHLTAEHALALKLHQRAARRGVIETVLITTAEVVASLKQSDVTGALRAAAGLGTSRAELLLREVDLPGREVACVVKAGEAFRS